MSRLGWNFESRADGKYLMKLITAGKLRHSAKTVSLVFSVSILLTGALYFQHCSFLEKSSELITAEEQFRVSREQDFQLRFSAGKLTDGDSEERHQQLGQSADRLKQVESFFHQTRAEKEGLQVMESVWKAALMSSYVSGTLLLVLLLTTAVIRAPGRANPAFPGRAVHQ